MPGCISDLCTVASPFLPAAIVDKDSQHCAWRFVQIRVLNKRSLSESSIHGDLDTSCSVHGARLRCPRHQVRRGQKRAETDIVGPASAP